MKRNVRDGQKLQTYEHLESLSCHREESQLTLGHRTGWKRTKDSLLFFLGRVMSRHAWSLRRQFLHICKRYLRRLFHGSLQEGSQRKFYIRCCFPGTYYPCLVLCLCPSASCGYFCVFLPSFGTSFQSTSIFITRGRSRRASRVI